MNTPLTFGQALRQARGAAGLTSRELGEKIGRTHATVSYWENGTCEPSIDVLKALTEHLPLEILFQGGQILLTVAPKIRKTVLK